MDEDKRKLVKDRNRREGVTEASHLALTYVYGDPITSGQL